MANVTRRAFSGAVAAGAVSALALPRAFADGRAKADQYSFLLLGDTHFDRIEHHDMDWMREHYAKDISQVQSYCRHTKEQLPLLMKAAKKRMARTERASSFALHVGDLVEGVCGNKELAVQHCEEGWEFFKQQGLDIPLLMTKGNHDITGPGAVEAYDEVLLKRTAKELGRERLDGASYSFMQGNDLFAVFDAYNSKSIDWLEQVVSEHEFQRLFVMMHLPVVPHNARSNWRVYYHRRHAGRRQRLLDLLGKHRAIVLCGHLHKYSLLSRRTRTGRFVQLGISSILKRPPKNPPQVLKRVADYGESLTELEPGFSPDTRDARRQTLLNEKPFIEHFEYSARSGFAILSVLGRDVQAEIYSGVESGTPWKTVSLTKLLG